VLWLNEAWNGKSNQLLLSGLERRGWMCPSFIYRSILWLPLRILPCPHIARWFEMVRVVHWDVFFERGIWERIESRILESAEKELSRRDSYTKLQISTSHGMSQKHRFRCMSLNSEVERAGTIKNRIWNICDLKYLWVSSIVTISTIFLLIRMFLSESIWFSRKGTALVTVS